MKKVFIYVGHSNWGKSRALRVLTGNSSRQKTVQISQYNVRVRKMSNDDDGQGLLNWVRTFPRQNYQRFVIAFCPKVPPITGEATIEQKIALDILIELQTTNKLFFFVQHEKFNYPHDQITQQEINWLKTFGSVKILYGQSPDTIRAKDFLQYIHAYI
ncbi:hypothetical protein [Fontibacter flavus]|uniref:G domain-containing protein n=1 Tax=Fontibacter flavus TaxID=654838 RepID=A0ABV6FNT9_9BACT